MSSCTQDVGYQSERQCCFQNHSGYNMENQLEGVQDGSRPVRRFLKLSRHEVMVASRWWQWEVDAFEK